MVTTVNVKVYSDRTLSINKKVFGGMQTDIGSVEIVWDVSDVYNGNQYSIEIFGAAGTYSRSIPLGVVYDEVNTSRSVTYEIPPELTEIGGQAVVYLIEEQIENEAVKRRICTYPLRLYLPHRSASSNEVKVEKYNRQLTDMYLAVVRAREAMETLNKDSAKNLADAKAKLDKAILDYNRAIEVATGGINFGSGLKDFNSGDHYFGTDILKDNTYVVFIDGEVFAFDEHGAITLSEEYRKQLNERLDGKQFAFELSPDEALEFVEGANGKPMLLLKSFGEIYQDADGLHVDIGDGLKKDDYGRICADYTEHNVDEGSHNDIRLVIENLKTKVNTLLDSDDVTLDQMSEIVAYIKANKSLIDSVTTSKVNVADIIDNLTSNVSNKPLSAKQGVELKKLIDAIVIPTSLSEFNNDAGFVDDDYVDDAVESVNLPRNVRVTDYDSDSVKVAFESGIGGTRALDYDVDLTVDGKQEVFIYKTLVDGVYTYTLARDGEEPDGCEGRVYAFTYKVRNGAMHYLAVGSAVLLNKMVLIETYICDGTESNIIRSGYDFTALKIVCKAPAGTETFAGRLIVNEVGKVWAYFGYYVQNGKSAVSEAIINLENLTSFKGVANDGSGVIMEDNSNYTDKILSTQAIKWFDFGSYTTTQYMPEGTEIKIYGRERI